MSSKRTRGNSVSQELKSLEYRTNTQHPLVGSLAPASGAKPKESKSSRQTTRSPPSSPSGLWSDVKTMRWMTSPSSSFKLLMIVFGLWAIFEAALPLLAPGTQNPFAAFIFVPYQLPADPSEDGPRYGKGPLDLLFVFYYLIFFSFVRQALTLHVVRPLARRWGIKKEAKLDRFGEQAYALIYFSCFGVLGVYVMSQLPTWWFRTEHFWLQYPHWRMTPLMKRYYLMQLSYWIQQLLVLLLRLEKPRKDFLELTIHHFVTIWLVGWSYAINLTYIGNAVFLTMDVSDIFIANSKVLNYLNLDIAATVAFGSFIPIWCWLRHYENIRMLISVWTEFDLIPEHAKQFNPAEGVWMVGWMKYQIFAPLMLLQMINIFYLPLFARVLYRALWTNVYADERSDDEDEGEEKAKKE